MIHLIFCLRRRTDMTREEFQRYWRETHGPLVRRHAGALGIQRYVQAHSIDHPVADAARQGRGAPEPYDGVAELWFDDDLGVRVATPAAIEASRALLEDERRFIDLERSPIFFARDDNVVG
jgi:uncharacterized protein (TIGR02118 family)